MILHIILGHSPSFHNDKKISLPPLSMNSPSKEPQGVNLDFWSHSPFINKWTSNSNLTRGRPGILLFIG